MFKGKLTVEAVEGEDAYILTSPITYVTNDGDEVVIPRGFKTNFASVPAIAKVYVDDNSHFIRLPSITHDFLYSKESAYLGFTRKQADFVLLTAMQEQGMRPSKALLIYYILRVFGGRNYEKR